MPDTTKKIIIISDGSGRTAKRLMDAVLAHYKQYEKNYILESIFSKVRTRRQVDEIIKGLEGDYLVVFSIISRGLRKYLHKSLHDAELLHLNVLEPMLETMHKFLGFHPDFKPGLLQIVDDRYYSKVDAIGFTVEHDDGLGHQIEDADLVLVGLSRTCKTPISMYLACNHGLKVANIPVIADEISSQRLIDRLERLPDERVIGLVMNAEVLASIREERAGLLAGEDSGRKMIEQYHDVSLIKDEIRFFRRLCSSQNWDVVNVTRRAIEEVSAEIMAVAGLTFDEIEP